MMEVLKGGNAPCHMVVTSPYFKADGYSTKGHGHFRTARVIPNVPEGWAKLTEIYKNSKVDYRQLQDYCRLGKFPSMKLEKKWYVEEASAVSYLKGVDKWLA